MGKKQKLVSNGKITRPEQRDHPGAQAVDPGRLGVQPPLRVFIDTAETTAMSTTHAAAHAHGASVPTHDDIETRARAERGYL